MVAMRSTSANSFIHALVFINYMSKWLEVRFVREPTAHSFFVFLTNVFAREGFPAVLHITPMECNSSLKKLKELFDGCRKQAQEEQFVPSSEQWLPVKN